MSDLYALRVDGHEFADALLLPGDVVFFRSGEPLEIGGVYFINIDDGPGCLRRVCGLTATEVSLRAELPAAVVETVARSRVSVQGRFISMVRRYDTEVPHGPTAAPPP